jgi:hypothetical protein
MIGNYFFLLISSIINFKVSFLFNILVSSIKLIKLKIDLKFNFSFSIAELH